MVRDAYLRVLTLLALDRINAPELVKLGAPAFEGWGKPQPLLIKHVMEAPAEDLVKLLLTGLLVRTHDTYRQEEGQSARAAALYLLDIDADAIKRDVEAAAKSKKPKKASSKTIAATTAKRGKRKA